MKVIITAGATIEKIDPVRYISNFSTGKQGYAIAKIFSEAGFETLLVSANCNLPDIANVKVIKVESAEEMLAAVLNILPADIAIFTAAVCDWKTDKFSNLKLKKTHQEEYLDLRLIKNPDILKTICAHQLKPKLVIGFAAETNDLIRNAKVKLLEKGCDVIIANSVAEGDSTFGSDYNEAYYITEHEEEHWPPQTKLELAQKLLIKINRFLNNCN